MNLAIQSPSSALHRKYQIEKLHPIFQFKPFLERLDDYLYYSQKFKITVTSISTIKKQFIEFLQFFYKDYLIEPQKYDEAIELYAIQFSKKEMPYALIQLQNPYDSKDQFISSKQLNRPVFYDVVIAFLYEKLIAKNTIVQSIVLTNFEKWYIFDIAVFEAVFLNQKNIITTFLHWQSVQTISAKESLIHLLATYIKQSEYNLQVTFFSSTMYQNALEKGLKSELSKEKEIAKVQLANLYKILSPKHLIAPKKIPFHQAYNPLFFKELLHIMGLEQVKNNKTYTIQKASRIQKGSLLNNTILQLKAQKIVLQLRNRKQYGTTETEQHQNIAYELVITWLNRLLFLKMLEGQLVTYHADDEDKGIFQFLTPKTVDNFQTLHTLFFEVIAVPVADRQPAFSKKYQRIPYLNSSLFETTPLEAQTLSIADLDNHLTLDLMENSILKKETSLPTLSYLIAFLEAYNFGVYTSESIIYPKNKPTITANDLGIILEKLNANESGFEHTPNTVLTSIAQKTVQEIFIQRFNAAFKQHKTDIKAIQDFLSPTPSVEQIKSINQIINTLKICDPAVGSGRFLVAILHELLVLKSQLGVLCDTDGHILKGYTLQIDANELLILDAEHHIFQYKIDFSSGVRRLNPGSQRIQEAIFNEKQYLIEHCLFGVDTNENAVKMCQLRLWLELLQHIYYLPRRNTQLATLPNIEINIKKGNALVSRFGLTDNLKEAFKKSYFSVEDYKQTVASYKATRQVAEKQQLAEYIEDIKLEFSATLGRKDKERLAKVRGQYEKLKVNLTNNKAFGFVPTPTEQQNLQRLKKRFDLLQAEQYQMLNATIYNDAFEWRFEFPEILDNEGNFQGFDVICTFPPHDKPTTDKSLRLIYKNKFTIYNSQVPSYLYFLELALLLLKPSGIASLLTSQKFETTQYGLKTRTLLTHHHILHRNLFPINYPAPKLQHILIKK